jgi:hypothetical protein
MVWLGVLFLGMVLTCNSFGEDWDNGAIDSNLWQEPNNWVSDNLPWINTDVYINLPGESNTPLIQAPYVAYCGRLSLGHTLSDCFLTMTGGVLDVNSSGSHNGDFTMANNTDATGTFNLSGGVVSVGGDFKLGAFPGGANAVGTLNQSGGSISVAGGTYGGFVLGHIDGTKGVLNLSDGTLHSDGLMELGWMGDAEVTMSGGVLDAETNIVLGEHSLSEGATFEMSGGQIVCGKNSVYQGLYVGQADNGFLNMTDGTIETSGLSIGHSTGRGEMHIDGGTVTCAWLLIDKSGWGTGGHTAKSPASVLDIYGGTLKIAGDRREDSNVEDVLMDGINDLVAAGYITSDGTDEVKVVYDGAFTVVTADCPEGDLNNDCYVDFKDFAILAATWLNDFDDLAVLAANWLL